MADEPAGSKQPSPQAKDGASDKVNAVAPVPKPQVRSPASAHHAFLGIINVGVHDVFFRGRLIVLI
jgi:hypothetical protein